MSRERQVERTVNVSFFSFPSSASTGDAEVIVADAASIGIDAEVIVADAASIGIDAEVIVADAASIGIDAGSVNHDLRTTKNLEPAVLRSLTAHSIERYHPGSPGHEPDSTSARETTQ